MIDAAQPTVFESAVAQVGAAVRAVAIDEAESCLVVAKQHQLFAQQRQRQWSAAGGSSSDKAAGCQ
jgi:hypothetical protein